MKWLAFTVAIVAGLVALGVWSVMPPSVVLIVYGILTEQSIGQLFVAGIIPAILVTILFIISIYVRCRLAPEQGPPGESFPWRERLESLWGMGETVAVFILVIGGLFIGLFTPTEAAAVGVFGVLVASLIRRRLTWAGIVQSLYESLRTSCMVMLLIAGAAIFGKFLAVTRIPFNIAAGVGELNLPPFLIMGIIILIYFLGGCFMDALAFVMLTIPIFYPVVTNLGYDPIWFGIIIVMVTEMGVITPPVGINVYVVYGVARGVLEDISLESIFKGILPFLIAVIIGLVILMAFPQIILFLPNLMY